MQANAGSLGAFAWMLVAISLLYPSTGRPAEKNSTDSRTVTLLVSGVPSGTHPTLSACDAEKQRRRAADAALLEKGQRRYTCRQDDVTLVYFQPAASIPVDADSDGVPDASDRCPSVHATTADGCPALPPAGRALFFDDFEYDVSRSGFDADAIFAGHQWSGVKANNSSARRGGGWVYTRADATRGSRVLVLESVPGPVPMQGMQYSQTDYYVQHGREGSSTQVLPANVWIQFWSYATPESRFSTRDKTLYPCNSAYPCSWGPDLGWLFMWGSGGFNTSGDRSSRRFLAVEAQNADHRGDREYPTNRAKLGQNLVATPLSGGRWYQIRLHFDTSGPQGTYEAWVREHGVTAWTKVSDWRGGVTPQFFWPIPADQRRGHAMLRAPTTVNGPGSSTVYIDDFVIAESVEALPN